MSESGPFDELAKRSGAHWLAWMSAAAGKTPELTRSLQFLASADALLGDASQLEQAEKKLRQAILKFVGQARCPSALSCDKLALRAGVLGAWLGTESARYPASFTVHSTGAAGIERLLAICEGADDRHGVLTRAVRQLVHQWLAWVANQGSGHPEALGCLYGLAMADQVGLVEPVVWWRQLAEVERTPLLALIEQDILAMPEMQPSSQVSWRSFEKRWQRLRLKSLLEFLKEPRLLAELLRRSAVDDFEAVEAIRALLLANRARDAIAQAEGWMRAMPRSPVLAQALFDLYIQDGWDDEALELLRTHFQMDPNPLWLNKLKDLDFKAAKALHDELLKASPSGLCGSGT